MSVATTPRLRPVLVGLIVAMSGCSYAYDVQLDGQILVGTDHLPLANAKIAIFHGTRELATATTSATGQWSVVFTVSDHLFLVDSQGREVMGGGRAQSPELRVEVGGKQTVVPLPLIHQPTSGRDIFTSVLLVLEPPLERAPPAG
jgi:hypothetical protein